MSADQRDRGTESGIGTAVERREDPALLTGRASFVDDLDEPGTIHASMVRSRFAHAWIEAIDTSAAEELDGVIAVFTAEDIEASGTPNVLRSVGMMVPDPAYPEVTEPHEMYIPEFPLLADEKVRHQGQALAVVVGEDRYTASEGAARVEVTYERMGAVTDPKEATDEGAPPVYDDNPGNIVFDWEIGPNGPLEEAFESADHVIELDDITHPRVIPSPIEPRGVLASFDSTTGKLTVRMTSQNPHHHRLLLSKTLEYPEQKIRVIAPDIGGGFGVKIHHYPDEALTAWCSMKLDRPVKWIQTRSEAHLTDAHGRGHRTSAAIAVDSDGYIQGVQVDSYASFGAYVSTHAPLIPTGSFGMMLPGPFDIPAYRCRVIGAFTHAAPVDAYRGAGMPEANFVMQRLLHRASQELDMDPVDLWRRNFIPPDAFPAETIGQMLYDSGNYEKALDKAIEVIGLDDLRRRQADARDEGRYIGIGLCSFVELTGLGPSTPGVPGPLPTFMESSTIRFHPSGTIAVYTGTSSQGQGHQTVFAQIVADKLGVPYEDIEVMQGNTDEIPQGTGAFASRSAAVGGGSMARSAEKVVEKARSIAAHQLEASEDDIEFEGGEFIVTGAPDRSMHIQDVAEAAFLADDLPEGTEPSLEATTHYDPELYTSPFGTQIVAVEVDPESGEVDILRYVAVDDCGIQINPTIVEGQIHGGIAQGLGPARGEEAAYDENGQLISGSLTDYPLPKASNMPELEVEKTVTPSPMNPLGVKGIGEAGTIPAPTAFVNAVVDALAPLEVDHINLPATEEAIWRAIREASNE